MDYKELIRALRFISKCEKRREYNEINVGKLMEQAATAITDLLARAEAAEKELADCREKNAGLALALLTEQPPNSDCLGYQERQAVRSRVKAAEARAEKAERERDAAVKTLDRLDAQIDIALKLAEEKFWSIETCEQSVKKEE